MRIKLDAGEERTFELPVPEKAFTAVSNDGERKIFSDTFTLYAGVCQPDELSERLSGTKCASVNIMP